MIGQESINVDGIRTSEGVLRASSARLDSWIEREAFRGWDPFDALNSPLLNRLTFGSRRLAQIWVQLLKYMPINLRPLLRVPKEYNPKSMGLFLASYWRKYLFDKDPVQLQRARFFAEWLSSHCSPGYSGACWGYNFDWPNRAFFAAAGTPTIVNTAFNGLAFVDLISRPQPAGVHDWAVPPINVAQSACDFILNDLWADRPASDERCFSYTPLDRRLVHNANVLGAWLLAEVASRTFEPELRRCSVEAARFTARRQRADGSWPYGEASNDNWIDNLHTAYVLTGLKRIGDLLEVREFDHVIERGYSFWKQNLFVQDGTPKYFPHSIHPIDTHSVAQAILTFLAFADSDGDGVERARALALWAIRHLQDKRGYFHFQVHRTYTIRIPYMRWTQAWMQRSLTELLACEHSGHAG
jgi:hypothetical protein